MLSSTSAYVKNPMLCSYEISANLANIILQGNPIIKYRDSPVSAVSISALFDLVRFTNSTKQH